MTPLVNAMKDMRLVFGQAYFCRAILPCPVYKGIAPAHRANAVQPVSLDDVGKAQFVHQVRHFQQ